VPGAQVGELFFLIIKTQFEAFRDGDRYWYRRTLSKAERCEVEKTGLSDINQKEYRHKGLDTQQCFLRV
jgi:hypothetical protein